MNRADAHALWLYTRTHHGLAFVCSAGVLGGLLVLGARTSRLVPTWDGSTGTPLTIAALTGMGILTAATRSNRGGQQEDSLTTRIPARVRLLHPLVITLGSSAFAAATGALVSTSGPQALSTARAVVLMSSLAFIGADTGRSFLAWCLPAAYFIALTSVGYAPSGTPVWWNVPMLPFDDPRAWLLTAIASIAAGAAVWRAAR